MRVNSSRHDCIANSHITHMRPRWGTYNVCMHLRECERFLMTNLWGRETDNAGMGNYNTTGKLTQTSSTYVLRCAGRVNSSRHDCVANSHITHM